ncbi:MAG: HD domain-containing protein [Proteobacteria bacterium]|nr:HD domain-containing protein [Pseudomonadota bacterium]
MIPESQRTYEIRCPVYGFIQLTDWEWQIISQPAFQRLRRIRQLAWTDYVYPGAMHTRFEHSLGVMHMATMLYDGIVQRSLDTLRDELGYNKDGLNRDKVLVRLAALLHDVGHAPFSHATEDLFPKVENTGERFKHEHYSAEIVRRNFADAIKNGGAFTNYGLTAEDVANFLEGKPEAGKAMFWRELVDGQMDADRMDYLLRDSIHSGVSYGRYDWPRLVHTVVAVPSGEESGPRLGVAEGGWHAAEGLILARYFMFTQVYFHKTRVAFDHHLQKALGEMLPQGHFPAPRNRRELDDYLKWDDWRVLGLLANGKGGEHGQRLANRNHFREITHTPETPTADDLARLDEWRGALGDLLAAEIPAEKSWYKVGQADIPVISDTPKFEVKPLSKYSSVVKNIQAARQVRLYALPERCEEARSRIEKS